MSEPIRIAVLGLSHDHVWGVLEELSHRRDAVLVGASDPHPELGVKLASRGHACPFHADARSLLDREAPQAVLVFGDNRGGAEDAALALSRGVHAMIEKPMAADLEGARAVARAAQVGGARVMVNWPFAWWPALQHAMSLAQGGAIGRLWQLRYRAAHRGPRELGCSEPFCAGLYDERRNGAGAYMDYAGYGAVLACALLGTPQSALASRGRLVKTDIAVDDTAALILRGDRWMALIEAGWAEVGELTAYAPAFYGETGTLLVEREGRRLLLATLDRPGGEVLSPPTPPAQLASPVAHFLWAQRTGGEMHPLCGLEVNLRAQAALQAGLMASDRGCSVAVEA